MEQNVVDLGGCMARINSCTINHWSPTGSLYIVMPAGGELASQSVMIRGEENLIKLRDALIAHYPLELAGPVRDALDTMRRERDQLREQLEFMRDHWSPVVSRDCPACLYENEKFIRSCKIHAFVAELRAEIAALKALAYPEVKEKE